MTKTKEAVMITGCAGFIGSHATDFFLDAGHRVIGIDSLTYAGNLDNLCYALSNDKFFFTEEDICSTKVLSEICYKNNIGWIFNFAAETHVDNSIDSDDQFIRSNISGVKSLLEVCRCHKIKLFHISTDEVYGPIVSGSFSEDDKLSPKNPYSATKAAAEHLITSYQNTHGVDYIMVRPTNNFGPRQHSEKFIPTIVKSITVGHRIPIYGTGNNIRDWLFVLDNVQAIYDIWQRSPLNEVYNVSSKNEISNLDIVHKILFTLEKEFDENTEFVTDRLGHDFRYSVDNSKLCNLGVVFESNFNKNISHTVKSLSES